MADDLHQQWNCPRLGKSRQGRDLTRAVNAVGQDVLANIEYWVGGVVTPAKRLAKVRRSNQEFLFQSVVRYTLETALGLRGKHCEKRGASGRWGLPPAHIQLATVQVSMVGLGNRCAPSLLAARFGVVCAANIASNCCVPATTWFVHAGSCMCDWPFQHRGKVFLTSEF